MARDYKATVQALLNKADDESVTPDERVALLEKAALIMAEHSITDAMLAASGLMEDVLTSTEKTFTMSYSAVMRDLYYQIVKAFRCEAVMTNGRKILHVYGYKSDLDKIEDMFTYMVQFGQFELNAAMAERDPFGEPLKSFTTQFWRGFASRLHTRISAMMAQAAKAAESDKPGTALVLVKREELVTRKFYAENPLLRKAATYVRRGSGYSAGQDAANRANLGNAGKIGGKAAIGSGR